MTGSPIGGWHYATAYVNNFAQGAFLSHFDRSTSAFNIKSHMAPGFSPRYVMNFGFDIRGAKRLELTIQEIRGLQDLGYILDAGFLSGAGSFVNSNTPPFTDDWTGEPEQDIPFHLHADTDPPDFVVSNDCSALNIELWSRPELHDAEADPIRVLPGSLFNIRGCGNGGNNHDQITVTSVANGDLLSFTPRQDFVGRAQFGFQLWDGKESGDLVFYTIDVNPGGCLLCDPDNIVINGDFEEGTEVTLETAEDLPNSGWLDGINGLFNMGRHLVDGHPMHERSSWQSWGGGQVIRDSWRECPNGSSLNTGFNHHTGSITALGAFPSVPSATGDRYARLANHHNPSQLCEVMQYGRKYRLQFDINFDRSTDAPGATYSLSVGFLPDIAALVPFPPVTDFSIPHDVVVPSAGTGWFTEVVEFYYCGGPNPLMNIQAPAAPPSNRVYYDNVVLRMLPPEPVTVDAGQDAVVTPGCGGGDCVTLLAIPDNERCGLQYLWSPALGLSDPTVAAPQACPLVTTTYTVVVTDPISGAAGSDEVTVVAQACCVANTTIPDGALASTTGTYFTGSVSIQGDFILDADVSFDNAFVHMGPGAEIIMQPGRFLNLQTSAFLACDGVMWKGITADDGCIVLMNDTRVLDSEFGLRALNSAILWVNGSEFLNNRAAITVPDQGQFNSVGIFVANTLFHAPGPLALPYPDQTSALGQQGFAGLDINRMSLDFTAGGNTFRNLSNGIVARRCDVSVSGCYMDAIQPDPAYAYSGNGAGIYAYGRKGWYTLKQQGFGMQGPPSFAACFWGIYTEYMNVRSADNRMEGMETAYHVERSGYRSVDLLNNDIRNHRSGIELLFNDGADHVLVQGNEIHFGDFTACSPCPSYSGILVSEGNYANPSSVIRNNILQYYLNGASRQGVNLITADDWLVADNELRMVHNIFSQTGVLQNGCRRTEVSCNLIHCADNNLINDRQAAIRSFNCTDALISCNDMDKTTNGMLFNGVGTGADVRGNSMRYHKYGLFLSTNAVVGVQDHRGNLWHLNPAPGGLGAENLNTNALGFPFVYNPQIISGGNTQPPSWSPTGWFNLGIESNYTCIDGIGDDYCGQFSERCLGCITELDERVAEGELENAPYTTETLYLLGAELYAKLDEHPDLLDAQQMTDFYADKQSSNLPLFKAIEDEKLALYDLAPAALEQLELNREEAEALTPLLHAALQELGDPALSVAARNSLLSVIAGYRQTLGTLAAYQATALDIASTSKALNAESVRIANQGITTSELIEANEKQVTDIYLATIGADVDEFTVAQVTALQEIAGQCPLVGGNAVFRARALYTHIDAGVDYDDALLCLPHGILIKSKVEAATSTVRIIPNPAMAMATLQLSAPLAAPATLVIRDALGTEVMRSRVPGQTSTWQLGLEPLAPALYHYQLISAVGVVGEGKLIIVQ